MGRETQVRLARRKAIVTVAGRCLGPASTRGNAAAPTASALGADDGRGAQLSSLTWVTTSAIACCAEPYSIEVLSAKNRAFSMPE